jgi:ABC-2 type transport system ATP-binding protein
MMLQTEELCKKYKKHVALDACSLTVKRGDIYGFVGNNGAGKTTLMRIVMGLAKPSGGDYRLFGTLSFGVGAAVRRRVGAIIEAPTFYPHMTGFENLRLHQLAIGQRVSESRIKQAMDTVRLGDERTKKVRGYSMGMKQRLGIARILLSDVEFAILDEPTNGLDPAGILELRNLILSLNREKGTTFLISSHHILELDGLVTRVGVIKAGKMVEEKDYAHIRAELDVSGESIEDYFIKRAC